MSTPSDYDPMHVWKPPSNQDQSSSSEGTNTDSYVTPAYATGQSYGAYPQIPAYNPNHPNTSSSSSSYSDLVNSYWTNPTASHNPSYGSSSYGTSTGYGIQGPAGYNPYAPPSSPAQSSKRNITNIAIACAVIIIICLFFSGFIVPGWFVTKKLDIAKAQDSVRYILTDDTHGYGIKNVKDVHCNPGGGNPTIKKGKTFRCDMVIDGAPRHLNVTFLDNSGTYEVGRPQ